MALGGLDVVVKFIGDASSIEKEAAKVEGTGGKLKSWAKGIGAAIGTAFVVDQMKNFVSAAEEADVASNRLAQTLRNAGDASGAWAKKAEALATSLMNKTGVDDEVIKGGQAILATFHSVSDATAQQNGIFAKATTLSLDLAKTGFGDMDSGAKALGKALEDPVKGITALKKSGVNFTDAQKDMIAAMVATGDKAGAQKLILKEVENQVGGVAEKTATSADKMKTSWGETQEALGHALLPVLKEIAPPLQKIAKFVQDNATWLVPLAAAIAAVVLAIKAWSIAQAILNVLMDANPIGLIVIGIAALIAAVVLIVTHFDIFKQAAIDAFNWVLDAVKTVWNWISANWPLLLAILTGPIGIAIKLIVDNWDTIKQAVSNAIDFITGLWNSFVAFVSTIPGRISSALAGLANIIKKPFEDAWGYIQTAAGWISGAFDKAIGAVKGVWNAFARGWNGIALHIPSIHIPWPIDKDVGGETISLPNLPILAQGGIAKRATLALIGEAGPEAVVPLKGNAMGSVVNTFNIEIAVASGTSPAVVGAAVVDQIRAYERLAGKSWRK